MLPERRRHGCGAGNDEKMDHLPPTRFLTLPGNRRAMSEKEKGSGKGLESRRAYYRLVIGDLTMMSDMFMRCVLKEKACIQEVLRIPSG